MGRIGDMVVRVKVHSGLYLPDVIVLLASLYKVLPQSGEYQEWLRGTRRVGRGVGTGSLWVPTGAGERGAVLTVHLRTEGHPPGHSLGHSGSEGGGGPYLVLTVSLSQLDLMQLALLVVVYDDCRRVIMVRILHLYIKVTQPSPDERHPRLLVRCRCWCILPALVTAVMRRAVP